MHQHNSQNVAILYFTRSAKAEGMNKAFTGRTVHQNTDVARLLIDHTQKQIEETGLPFFIIDETRQVGSSFGERFAHAFQQVFNKGFDSVIAVGNDTPQLRADHLLQAAKLLSNGSSQKVIGPAADGGTWLMGYHQKAFCCQIFKSLPWNSSSLLDTLLEQTSAEIQISLLEDILPDIDNSRTLVSFLKKKWPNEIISLLVWQLRSLLFNYISKFSEQHTFFPSLTVLPARLLRAPPLVS